jgi:hypothetical protein
VLINLLLQLTEPPIQVVQLPGQMLGVGPQRPHLGVQVVALRQAVALPRAASPCPAALPYAVGPPSGDRAGSGAAMTNGPGSITTNDGGPGDGLLGFAWLDGAREATPPEPRPRRRHLGFKHGVFDGADGVSRTASAT